MTDLNQFYVELVEALDLDEAEQRVYAILRDIGFMPHQIRAVVLSYRDPLRHWHTMSHIGFMLDRLHEHAQFSPNLVESRILIVYHDVICKAQNALPSNYHHHWNEQASARLLLSHMQRAEELHGLSFLKDQVARTLAMALIAEAGGKPGEMGDADTHTQVLLLHDLDYAVFAFDAEAAAMHDAIAAEYAEAGFAGPQFEEGRANFLRSLQNGIYWSPYFAALWEERGQINVAKELEAINGSR